MPLLTLNPATFLLGYIDPGTGSVLLQVMLAALLSGAYFARNLLGGVKQAFSGSGKKDA